MAATYQIRNDDIHESSMESEETLLCRRFLAGDDDAFVTLYRRHHRRLHLYCLKMVGDASLAEDLTQEMWERVIELRRDPREVRSPLGLFHRIARNLCLDHIKLRKHHVPLDSLAESQMPGMASREPSPMEDLVSEALDRLPFETREILVMNLYCGYRFDEIAMMLGRTPDAVWARASRGRAQLRRIVAEAVGAMRNGSDGTGTGER